MITPQPGIFAQGTRSHYHLEFDVSDDASIADVGRVVGTLRELIVPSGGANMVIGFGPELWKRMAPEHAPVALASFLGISRPASAASTGQELVPSTPHDLWVWLHGTGPDVMLDAARAVTVALAPCASPAAEQPCFVYQDSRDLTGFIDGTENPPVEAGPEVAIVPLGSPGEGGSFVITMKWVHDLGAFHSLSLKEQERVIGRTKADSVELDDKPDTAHISRVVIEGPGEDGEPAELEIYRRSTPYGVVNEHGLYFVAFSVDPTRFDKMLARMYGTTDDGRHDRLTEFTRPVSCAYYFAPALELLGALGG